MDPKAPGPPDCAAAAARCVAALARCPASRRARLLADRLAVAQRRLGRSGSMVLYSGNFDTMMNMTVPTSVVRNDQV
jgi:hypothetical protein